MKDREIFDEDLEEELYEHLRIKVDGKQAQLRIDKFLLDRLEKTSRNRIQNAIKSGNILVNEEQVKPNYKVRPKDIITMVLPKPLEDSVPPVPEDIPLDIRYEDDDLMVVHKPAGMVVHPGIGNYTGTLVNALAYHLQGLDLPIRDDHPDNRLGLVHRIDKDTSGLLVVAKTEEAMNHLAKQFFKHSIYRRYWALVWGEPEEEEGTIKNRIGRNPKNRLVNMVYDEDMEGGKWAITHYKVLERLYYVSLIECKLETGRTHQIRVHMSDMGHPIFSDDRYGGGEIKKGTVFSKYKKFVQNCFKMMPRQALHARSLGFVHPRTEEYMQFDADLPEDFQSVLDKWTQYVAHRKELL
jgi:23S rRNA pseudouridine1911/1915/1917 synthase